MNSSVISTMSDALVTQTAQQPGGMMAMFNMLIPFVLIFVIFYFLVVMPQKKQQKKHQEMLNALQKGDRVVTTSGLFGRIVEVKEQSFKVEIAPKVIVSLQKSAVTTKVQDDEASETKE